MRWARNTFILRWQLDRDAILSQQSAWLQHGQLYQPITRVAVRSENSPAGRPCAAQSEIALSRGAARIERAMDVTTGSHVPRSLAGYSPRTVISMSPLTSDF